MPINLPIQCVNPNNNLPGITHSNLPAPLPNIAAPTLPNGGFNPPISVQSPIPIGGKQISVELPRIKLPVSLQQRKPILIPLSDEFLAKKISDTNETSILPKENIQLSDEEEIRRLYGPRVFEVLDKIDLEGASLNDVIAIFMKEKNFPLEMILKYINPKNLLHLAKNNGIEYITNNIRDFQNGDRNGYYSITGNYNPNLKQIICFKLLMNGVTPNPAKTCLDKFSEIIKFLETHYSEQLNEILSNPNLDLIALDPTEYGLPEIVDITGNRVIIKEKSRNPKPVLSFINANNNMKMYTVTGGNHILLNDSSYAFIEQGRYLSSANHLLVCIDEEGFAEINSKYSESYSYRDKGDETHPEEEFIRMKTNDGGTISKHTYISSDKKNTSFEIILTDKDGNTIFEYTTKITQRPNGNTVTRTINGKTETFTSCIENDEIRVIHSNPTRGKAEVLRFKDMVASPRPFAAQSIQAAVDFLKNGEFTLFRDKQVQFLAEQTINNFRIFLSKVNADDLYVLQRNAQKIFIDQFGYTDKKVPTYNSRFYFDNSSNSINVDPFNPRGIANTHEFGHGIDKVLRISQNTKIQNLYNEELKNLSPIALYLLDYFLTASAAWQGGLSELVAESNAIMNAPEMKYKRSDKVAVRGQLLMREFPRTITAIMEELAKYKASL